MSVPAKDCPHSWHSDRSHRGGPKREILPHAIRGGVNADYRKILGHSVKNSDLGIPDPRLSAESAYNSSKAASGELVDSLLGGTALNYVGHRACVFWASAGGRKERKYVEMVELDRKRIL